MATALSERYVLEGLLTSSEPSLVPSKGDVSAGIIDSFSLGYVKGKARICTLLALIHYYHSHGEKLPDIIVQTADKIHVKCMFCTDMQAEAFYGMRIAYRSSIRKVPNVVSWCATLLKLQSHSCEPVQVMQSWNATAPKNDKITGGLAMSVRSVLTLPQPSRDTVFDTVRRTGWRNSPYTSDNLSSKKLAVGQAFVVLG